MSQVDLGQMGPHDLSLSYEQFLGFALRTNLSKVVPNDTRTNFVLTRAFLASVSGCFAGLEPGKG